LKPRSDKWIALNLIEAALGAEDGGPRIVTASHFLTPEMNNPPRVKKENAWTDDFE
jgi:hypothetical protein